VVEVESRTSMKGSMVVRASNGDAKGKTVKTEPTMSTINTEKNPPSQGIKGEI